MSVLGILARIITHLVTSEFASRVAHHVIREATAALVREVQHRTRKQALHRTPTMS